MSLFAITRFISDTITGVAVDYNSVLAGLGAGMACRSIFPQASTGLGYGFFGAGISCLSLMASSSFMPSTVLLGGFISHVRQRPTTVMGRFYDGLGGACLLGVSCLLGNTLLSSPTVAMSSVVLVVSLGLVMAVIIRSKEEDIRTAA